jgi:hypothetical protein
MPADQAAEPLGQWVDDARGADTGRHDHQHFAAVVFRDAGGPGYPDPSKARWRIRYSSSRMNMRWSSSRSGRVNSAMSTANKAHTGPAAGGASPGSASRVIA